MRHNELSTLGGCFLWVLNIACWIIVGMATYAWMNPSSFWEVISWLVVWHIVQSIVTFVILLIFGAISSFME